MTLRGGGLFVVDAKATPMAIVGEYDKTTVKGNGCGGVQVGERHVHQLGRQSGERVVERSASSGRCTGSMSIASR